jgi:hypothetical protein
MELSLLPYENEDRLRKFTDTMIRFRAQELREKKFAACAKPPVAQPTATDARLNIQAVENFQVERQSLGETPDSTSMTYSLTYPSMLPSVAKHAQTLPAPQSQPLDKPINSNPVPAPASPQAPSPVESTTPSPAARAPLTQRSSPAPLAFPGHSDDLNLELPTFTRLYPHNFQNPRLHEILLVDKGGIPGDATSPVGTPCYAM